MVVGLSVILEEESESHTQKYNYYSSCSAAAAAAAVINKLTTTTTTHLKSPKSTTITTSSSSNFLKHCFLCTKKLLPHNDIYMYLGDRGFCSVECRSRQIYVDEQETVICSLAATIRNGSIVSSSAVTTSTHSNTSSSTNHGFHFSLSINLLP